MPPLTRSQELRLGAIAIVLLLAGIIASQVVRPPEQPEAVASDWVRASLSADCDRWTELVSEPSRKFLEGAGGCPLEAPTAGSVEGSSVRRAGDDVTLVAVDVSSLDEPVLVLLVRTPAGSPWRVDLTATSACAAAEGDPGSPRCTDPSVSP